MNVPIERILIETDAPYLAPVPYRGKPNEPAYVKYVAEKIAELKKLDFATVAAQTTRNYFAMIKSEVAMGRTMGIEPTTTGSTIQRSTN